MDEDDDATDFLGSARGPIPSAPAIDLSESPIFIPGWGYQVDNPGRDLQSCRDYVRHAMPPAIGKKMSSLSIRQSINRGIKSTFDNFMWNINTLHVTDHVDKLNRKLGLMIRDERAKAKEVEGQLKAEKEEFDRFRQEHAADIAKVGDMAAEIESLKAKLADQEKKAESMEASLQQSGQELNTANIQRDEAIAARDEAIVSRDAAIEEKKKLQAGIPDLFFASMNDPEFKTPFAQMVKCARSQGQHEVAFMCTEHLSPLPTEIAAKIDPDAPARARAAGRALAELSTTPFLEKLTENLDMPVDALLALKP